VIGTVLADKYAGLAKTGWPVTSGAIAADVERLLKGNFLGFLDRAR